MSKYLRRPGPEGGSFPPPADPQTASKFPALWEYLTCSEEEGKDRQTATLTIFAEEGKVKLCLNDRETGHTCWKSADTFLGAMEAMEKDLSAGKGEWRVAKGRASPRKG